MRRQAKGRVLCIALLMLWQTSLFAAKWQVHPTLKLAETYSDNIALAPPGREETEYVTEINPGISLNGQGRRVKLNLAYSLQNTIYASAANRNSSNHRLAASGSAELVKDIFFVDARSSIFQQSVNARGRVGLDNLNLGNRANVFTYGISPYLKLHLASFANAELRFSDDRVENQSSRISDAESRQYTARLNSGRSFARLQWDANYQQHDVHRIGSNDSQYQSANANIRYHVLSSWSLLARGGYEDNTLPNVTKPYNNTLPNVPKPYNGSYWSAGLEWTPSPHFSASATTGENNRDANLIFSPTERTSLNVGYQNREIGLVRGASWNATLTHRTRHTTWRGSYSEKSTTVQTLQLTGQQFFHLVDSQGNLIVDPNTGLPVILVSNVFSLTDEDFVRKRGQLTITINTAKSSIVVGVFNERRTYLLSNNSEDVFGTTTSWNWHFTPRTRAVIGGGWQRRNPPGTDLHEDTWHGTIGLIQNVSHNATASLEYSHLQHNTFVAYGDYGENRVNLQLTMRF